MAELFNRIFLSLDTLLCIFHRECILLDHIAYHEVIVKILLCFCRLLQFFEQASIIVQVLYVMQCFSRVIDGLLHVVKAEFEGR